MNKKELALIVAQTAGLTNASALRAVDAVVDTISRSIARDENVNISGFGKFSLVRQKQRTGRNPRTGDTIKIKATNRAVFKPGILLKKTIN